MKSKLWTRENEKFCGVGYKNEDEVLLAYLMYFPQKNHAKHEKYQSCVCFPANIRT
jgi:hypothetical protein